jgi:hypothetical protein
LTLIAAVFGGLAVALVVRDPHVPYSWGVCPFFWWTGLYCPGCGSLRAFHDFLTGHLQRAAHENALLPFAVIWLVWWWVHKFWRALGRPLRAPPQSAAFCWTLLGVLTVFCVARNLPGSPLAPR